MTRLPRPVKNALTDRTWDAEVTRGWARLQLKRRVGTRSPLVPVIAAAAAVMVVAAVWVAARPSQGSPVLPRVEDLLVPSPPARLSSCVEHAPLDPDSVIPVAMSTPAPASLSPAKRALPVTPACTSAPEAPDVVGELLLGVDDAWGEKDAPRMEALLTEIAHHHEDDPRAAQALFVLGRLQLEYRHDASGAAESFHHALELDPPAELVGPLWQAYELAAP